MPQPLAGERNDRESLWSVSAKRLPYYFLVFAPLFIIASIAAIVTASGTFWADVFTVAQQIAALCAAALSLMVMIEGLTVGVTKVLIERAKEEGVRQGVQQERERIRQAGGTVPPETPQAEQRKQQPENKPPNT